MGTHIAHSRGLTVYPDERLSLDVAFSFSFASFKDRLTLPSLIVPFQLGFQNSAISFSLSLLSSQESLHLLCSRSRSVAP